MNQSHEEWQVKYQRREEVHRRWQSPIIIAWLGVLAAWYFFVYHYCPDTFNRHRFDPRVHQVITADGDIIDDASAVADDDGYVYADKWRDPRTKTIYTPTHPDVVRGERAEKIARAVVTFLCGLPLIGVYRLRAYERGDNRLELRELTLKGILACLACGVISYFIPVVELALRLASAGSYQSE